MVGCETPPLNKNPTERKYAFSLAASMARSPDWNMAGYRAYYDNHQFSSAVCLVCSYPMKLTIHVPDDLLEDVKDELASAPSGILETIALDAILGFLDRLRDGGSSIQKTE